MKYNFLKIIATVFLLSSFSAAADVQVGEASYHGEEAEDEADAETDEIEGVHVIWCSA